MKIGQFPARTVQSSTKRREFNKKGGRKVVHICSTGIFIHFVFCHLFSGKRLSCLHECATVHVLKISPCVFVVPCKAPLVVPFRQT